MKLKRKNHSVIFRGFVLAVAVALAVLCAPVDGLVALAQMAKYTDYTYMTIGSTTEEVSTTVAKGQNYVLPNAYIGDTGYKVGKVADDTILVDEDDNTQDVILKSSKVTVNYSSLTLAEIDSSTLTDTTDITNQVVVTPSEDNYGYFRADRVGTYTITYSYSYTINNKTYTCNYDLKVESEITSASVSFDNNQVNFIPSIIDLSQLEDGEGDLYLPTPRLFDENGDEEKNVTYVTDKEQIGSGNYVLITANGGVDALAVEIKGDAATGYYISRDNFTAATHGTGKYSVRYAYYINGEFITATTKSTQVYDEYYEDYKLTLELASDWSDNAERGIEAKLPAAKGLSKKNGEEVGVYYTVKAYYKANSTDKTYELLSATDYNKDVNGNETIDEDEKVVNADGTLVDSTKFKPLNDGYYTFVYTIKDFYGNTDSSSIGRFEFTNVTDKQNPTPIVYDASVESEDLEDASAKLATRSVPNSVIVYAIGMEDNVSKVGDKDITLTRKIMTSDTVVKATIEDYDDKNLVFNYRDSGSNKACVNLLTNNYLIRKEAGSITTDTAMLTWLKENNYLIVVDNANAEKIYDIFNAENYFDANEDVVAALDKLADDATDDEKAAAKKTAAIAWIKSSKSTEAGFAYINVNETFGATTSENGMGSGQYYIHYIAKDAAGNEKDISKSMYVGSFEDNDSPKITFSKTLSDSYLPTAEVTFDAPTASDTYDTNMLVRTMYRYLGKNGIITLANSTENLKELRTDLQASLDGSKLATTYADYLKDEANGYIELTDKDASSYTIDLSEAGKDATLLQIVVFTYDDKGNPTMYAQTINILNTVDNLAPKFLESGMNATDDNFVSDYLQGAEIELPSMSVYDDAVGFVTSEVNVYYVNGNVRTKVSNYDSTAKREILNDETGAGRYTIYPGKFIAANAGTYEVSIAVKDSKNNTVVSFVNYNVRKRTLISQPVINTSLESQTIELDGDSNYNPEVGIELPVPSVSYQIENSVTYKEFAKSTTPATDFADVDYVIRGVDENGKAINYTTTYGKIGSFVASAKGEYDIMYTVNLEVYNHKVFSYQPMVYTEDSFDEGGYYNFTNAINNKTAKVYFQPNGYFVISNGVGYDVKNNKNGVATVYQNGIETSVTGTVFDGINLDSWFEDLRFYTLTSDVYTIKVTDSKGPVLPNYDYETSIAPEKITEGEGYKLKIYAIDGSDKSGISSDSKVVLSWKLANGESGSKTYQDLQEDEEYIIKSSNGNALDGTYTVTYTVYDNNGNKSEAEYQISVGDNVAPQLKIKSDNLVKDSYALNSPLKIDLSQIDWTDNKGFAEGVEPVIKLVNTSTSEEIELTEESGFLVAKLDAVGTYRLTIDIEDAVGNDAQTKTYTFEVTKAAKDTIKTTQVIGTVLIVISVLVLAGVIVYFVVSKVKLDKELKK